MKFAEKLKVNFMLLLAIFFMFCCLQRNEAAVKALNGRWFGGRMIKAELYDQEKFEANDLSH